MTIGERIVKLRREKNLTQREVAARAGMSITAVSFIETGTRSIDTLSLGRAKRLARALGVTVDYLCGPYEQEAHDDLSAVPAHHGSHAGCRPQ